MDEELEDIIHPAFYLNADGAHSLSSLSLKGNFWEEFVLDYSKKRKRFEKLDHLLKNNVKKTSVEEEKEADYQGETTFSNILFDLKMPIQFPLSPLPPPFFLSTNKSSSRRNMKGRFIPYSMSLHPTLSRCLFLSCSFEIFRSIKNGMGEMKKKEVEERIVDEKRRIDDDFIILCIC